MDIKLEKGAVQICRICLQDVEPDYPLLYLNFAISLNSSVTIQDKLMECVPEINLNAVPNAVICNECSIVLSSAYNFKLKCLRTEMQIKKYLQQINATTLFDLAEVQSMDVVNRNIKVEEVVIPDLKTELEDGSFNGSAVVDEDFNISTQEVLKNQCYTDTEYTDAYFSCYMCDYTTDSNADFSLHIENHAENFTDMVKMESQENTAVEASSSLLPIKSKERYEKCYSLFCEWRTSKKAKGIDENVMMTYFLEKAKNLKASSLWSMYSMIKSTLQVNENVDISSYKKLLDFLKLQNGRYVPKKSNMLTMENIMTFLNSAPDDTYLLMKVVLIFGLNGACRRAELCAVKAKDIEDTGSILVVTLQDRITNKKRIFTITSDCNGIDYYRKYACLRPKNVSHGRFFIYYKNGKCSPQPVGINSFGNMPKKIAEYLKLPNSSSYTGHCLRRTSATFLSDSGTDVRMLKRYRRHY